MESKYILEVSEYSVSYSSRPGKEDTVRDAAHRIQRRITSGNTIVLVRVNNPRYKGV